MSNRNGERRVIAICGKGGVGKTAFTTMLCRVLVESGRAGKLLLIDGDPASGLPLSLGTAVERTIGQVRESIIATAKNGNKKDKKEISGMIDYMVLEALVETHDYALLAMGHTDTLGCFCSVNDLLRDAIDILSKKFDTIVIDGEAGVEQINRQVMQRVDTLLILTDPSSRGMQTAKFIKEMVDKEDVMHCDLTGIIFNQVQNKGEDLLTQFAHSMGFDIFGFIPKDTNIADYDLIGRPLMELPSDSPALREVRRVAEDHILE